MPIYRYNGSTWEPMANIYRWDDTAWRPMNAIYRYNGSTWEAVYLRNANIPSISTAPILQDQNGSEFTFTHNSTITLNRGTWTNTGSQFAPIYYDLKIQYKTDSDTSWTNVTPTSFTPASPVGITGYNNYSTVSYALTLTDVRDPSYSYRGRVQVKNDVGESVAYTTSPVRSNIDVTLSTPTVTVFADRILVQWTTTPTNNSSNFDLQTVEIKTNEAYTYNGNSFSQFQTVYSTTVAPGSGQVTIFLNGTNIRPLGSFYAQVTVVANDTDGTTDSQTSSNFSTLATAYSFSIGNRLYVGTNGYIGLDGGSVGSTIPGTGRYLSIYPHDLVYNDIDVWSNNNSGTPSTQYVVYYDGYEYGQVGVASYRLRYMVKFYTDQPYVDVKIITRGTNLPNTKTAGFYSNGSVFSGLPGPYSLSTGTTFRLYYSPSASSAFGIGFTEIPLAAMSFPGTPTNGGADDGFWNILTANNVYAAPFYSSGPTLATRSSTSLSFNRTGGNDYAKTRWVARTGSYSGPITSSGTYTDTSTAVQVTGLTGSTTYYITFTPVNSLDQDGTPVQFTEFTSVPLTPPTSVSIASVSRATDSSVNVSLNFSGGSGPYYQMYWTTASTAPSTTSYDAASTGSPILETFSPSAGFQYYFYVRSSTDNLGNTTLNGNSATGTFSNYSLLFPNPSYTFTSPSGGTASIAGSTTPGSTLTLTTSSPSASPAADGITIIWRIANGGTGGNSFTGGTILQNGGTTLVIPSTAAGLSTIGYAIRAEVTFNNGVGSQVANSNSIVVTAPATKLSTPTNVVASDNRADGIQVSWTNVSNAATYGVWWGGVPSYDSNPDFGGPSNNGGKTITGSPFLDDGVTAGTTRNYYVQAFPTSGSTSFLKSDWSAGDSGTRISKLATPTNVSATDARTDGINVTWTAVSGANYYGVWYGPVPSYDSTPDFGGPNNPTLITGTSYLDTSMAAGVTRNYYVQAFITGNPAGTKSDWSAGDSGTRASAVSAPTNATQPTLSGSTSVGSTVTFGIGTWNNSPTSYDLRLYRGTQFVSSGETLVKSAGNVTSSTYTITSADFASGQLYLRAFASASNSGGSSGLVAGQEIGPITSGGGGGGSAPATPTNVNTSGSGLVTWTASSGATSYTVEYYTAQDGSGTGAAGPFYGNVGAVTSYQIPYSAPNNWARARVNAANASGTSAYSGFSPASGYA